MRIENSIVVNAPVDRVFGVFTDLEKAAERVAGIQKIEILEPPAQMQVGTKWRETRVMFGKEATEVMWVTELVPNTRYVVEAASHGAEYRTTYQFDETDGATTVQMIFDIKPVSFAAKVMGMVWRLFASSLRKTLGKDMTDLKLVAEGSS